MAADEIDAKDIEDRMWLALQIMVCAMSVGLPVPDFASDYADRWLGGEQLNGCEYLQLFEAVDAIGPQLTDMAGRMVSGRFHA